MHCIVKSFALLSTAPVYVLNFVTTWSRKTLHVFFGNAKRKSDSEENAPPSKKHPFTDTPDVPCTNSYEIEIPPGNSEILPSRSSSSVDPSTSPTADEVLVTSSRTFCDDRSVPVV